MFFRLPSLYKELYRAMENDVQVVYGFIGFKHADAPAKIYGYFFSIKGSDKA